jgi:hypothetical protein
MADKKDKKKGVVGKYNKQPVTKRKYYYDYHNVSKTEQGFADSFAELESFNTKLTDELKKEKTVKLQIHDDDTIKEGLLDQALRAQNLEAAKAEYRNYQKAGGTGDMATFLKDAVDLVKSGKSLENGADVVRLQG